MRVVSTAHPLGFSFADENLPRGAQEAGTGEIGRWTRSSAKEALPGSLQETSCVSWAGHSAVLHTGGRHPWVNPAFIRCNAVSAYKNKGSLRLPWGPRLRTPHGKSEMIILAKRSSVMVLVRHRSSIVKAAVSKRPQHSLPLHPLPFPARSRLWVGISEERSLQTPLTGAHARLKQLTKNPSAAVQAKTSCPKDSQCCARTSSARHGSAEGERC